MATIEPRKPIRLSSKTGQVHVLCHNAARLQRSLHLSYRHLPRFAPEDREMSVREQDEYRALRDTIRERGTARIWVFVAGISMWAVLTAATASLASTPMASLLPLLVLGSVFEAVFALHVGVERVGRYLQVFHETDGGWEHAAMAFGRPAGAVTTDALFTVPF